MAPRKITIPNDFNRIEKAHQLQFWYQLRQALDTFFLLSGIDTDGELTIPDYYPGKRPQTVRGAKGDETSGGDDDENDTQMRAHRREHTYECRKDDRYEST